MIVARRSPYRPASRDRGDAARAVGVGRRLADPRIAARDRRPRAASRTSSSTCSSRARRRARPRTSPRRSTRSAASSTRSLEGIRRLLHQGARRAPADRHRSARPTSSCGRRFAPDDIEREKKVILEEIKMVEDTPDDLVHEIFAQRFWRGHPLGRPILGTPGDGRGVHAEGAAAATSPTTYVAPNFVVAAAGNLDHDAAARADRRARVRRRRGRRARRSNGAPPGRRRGVVDAREGHRAEPRLPRHAGLSAEPRRSLRRATC